MHTINAVHPADDKRNGIRWEDGVDETRRNTQTNCLIVLLSHNKTDSESFI